MTTLPDIDRIARETPSLVLGVRDPGLQADVCNEKETSARHRRDPSLQGVRLGAPNQTMDEQGEEAAVCGTCPTQSECQREAESCIPFTTLPTPPPTVVRGGVGMAWPRPVAQPAQYPYAFGNHPGGMPLAREQRKLAAIVAADVVGYSRLMGRDESGTLAPPAQEPL